MIRAWANTQYAFFPKVDFLCSFIDTEQKGLRRDALPRAFSGCGAARLLLGILLTVALHLSVSS